MKSSPKEWTKRTRCELQVFFQIAFYEFNKSSSRTSLADPRATSYLVNSEKLLESVPKPTECLIMWRNHLLIFHETPKMNSICRW